MEVVFEDKKLEKSALDERKCYREMGKTRGELFLVRLNALYAATSLEDVRYMPGHFHELTGNRKGHWACSLDQPYRLVFRPKESPIPVKDNGSYDWMIIHGVVIEEITDYHE